MAVPESLPIEDPVLIFALAMTVFLVAPLVVTRSKLPGIVGIILVGAIIGPNALGVLERGETIIVLGQVGIVYLMFLAGLEVDRTVLAETRTESLSFGLLSFLLPQATGTVVGVTLLGLSLPAALLLASVFASHTLLAYPVVNRLGITQNRAVTAAIGGTILTDTLALLVLAVVAAAMVGDLSVLFWLQLVGGIVVFFVGSWLIIPRLAAWFFTAVTEESYFEYLFVMVVLFATAYAAELAGIEAIIGAFLAGLAINPLIPKHGVLLNRIEFVGNALFIPFFLLSVGMLVDLRSLFAGVETLSVTVALVAMVIVTKYAAAWLAGGLFGYSPAEVGSMFALSVGQAAAALAVTLVGFELGLFDQAVVNAVVLMILLISVLSPSLAERYGTKIARTIAQGPAETGRPQRVLLPFSPDSRHKQQLLSMAQLVSPTRDQPIYTVQVVQPTAESTETEQALAAAEAADQQLVAYAAGAEQSVIPQTRVAFNIASGIAQAATDNRISTIVMGWDGSRSRRQQTFGTVIDGVLQQTKQLVYVTRVREPLPTTQRLVVIVPPDLQYNDGFEAAVDSVETVAAGLGATVALLAVETEPSVIEARFETIEPTTSSQLTGFKSLLSVLKTEIGPRDFVVCLSARRGEIGWHRELQTLPKSISTLVEGNFAVVYPSMTGGDDDRRFLKLRDE